MLSCELSEMWWCAWKVLIAAALDDERGVASLFLHHMHTLFYLTSTFLQEKEEMPLNAGDEPKSSFLPSKWEMMKVDTI